MPIEGSSRCVRRTPRRPSSTCSRTRRSWRRSATSARSTSRTRCPAWPASASTRSSSAGGLARLSCDPVRDQDRRRAAAATGDRRDRRRGARTDPAHRHHRLGQVDDARGDDRPHQRELREAHRHDRGPGRVPPPRQGSIINQREGRRGHRLVRPRAAPRPASGPGRDPGRRDARRGWSAPRCPRPRQATSSSRRSTPWTPPSR